MEITAPFVFDHTHFLVDFDIWLNVKIKAYEGKMIQHVKILCTAVISKQHQQQTKQPLFQQAINKQYWVASTVLHDELSATMIWHSETQLGLALSTRMRKNAQLMMHDNKMEPNVPSMSILARSLSERGDGCSQRWAIQPRCILRYSNGESRSHKQRLRDPC